SRSPPPATGAPVRPPTTPGPTCREGSLQRFPRLRGYHLGFDVPDNFYHPGQASEDVFRPHFGGNHLGYGPAPLRNHNGFARCAYLIQEFEATSLELPRRDSLHKPSPKVHGHSARAGHCPTDPTDTTCGTDRPRAAGARPGCSCNLSCSL